MDQEILEKYIRGEASWTEKQAVLTWVKAAPSHRRELAALRKLYDLTIWTPDQPQSANKSLSFNKHLLRQIVAAAVVFLFLASPWIYIHYTKKPEPVITMQTIRVPAGQRVEVELTDGTLVWLNAGTVFTFPNHFSDQSREVVLNGEAYFEVQKDEHKPFVVKTNQHQIHVSGTAFNVLAYDHSPLYEVSLLSGSIEVKYNQQVVRPEPHSRVYMSAGKLRSEPILDYDYLLWIDGLICFEDESVDQMVSKLELYFDTDIIVENESFKNKKYTGKFRTKDGIEHILRVFQLKDRFVYEKDDLNNRITIK